MTKTVTTLDDKYVQPSGRVFMSSNQALVRLPLDQARRDRAAGLVTSGYISGYRGSPLGVYDAALWGVPELLAEHDIRFEPGLNEELAATAIRGTQELEWFGKSRFQGVFGLWYGKGVGVDRACEALKLGNMEGTSAHGGYLVVAGDDHGGKSSATAHQSEHTLIAGFIPVLYPSNTAEILEYGLYGWALSRYSGLYVGLKCITDTLDLSASVELPDPHRLFVRPDWKLPPEGLNLRRNLTPLMMEDWVVNKRLPAAEAWVRANPLDRVAIDSPRRTLGIVAAGKAYLDVRQALFDLGLDDARCLEMGIRLYKPAMIWPLEPEGAKTFARGHRALLIVEEKRPVVEDQLARLLYGIAADERPDLMGKRDLTGQTILPSVGELTPALVRKAIWAALKQIDLANDDVQQRFAHFHDMEGRALTVGGSKYRPAFYCSGCPHNTSTKIPDGSIAVAAVGCHGLAAYVMPERRTMQPVGMGADGMPWVSVAPLVDRQHIFQNMGDGTYSHSGILAIRAAVASKVNMTFKILYNDAVAMTGGQPVEMHLGPDDVVKQLLAEQVKPVIFVSDDPDKFASRMPAGVAVHHRDELDTIQRNLRELDGVSAIVYEQTCATEKRRRRKRGLLEDPDKRVFINPDVCEGCGDCSTQSNCISITPLETEFGRKRHIDQSTCNKDYSCIKGFCPSFVTVTGAKIATRSVGDPTVLNKMIDDLPLPDVVAIGEAGHNLLVAGIGGTGVLTVGALLGMAAHLEGKGCTVLDVTGMAQKGGAVTGHIRTGPRPDSIFTSRLGIGSADLILACDMIVASGADVLKTVKPGRTVAVVNSDVTPTGEFQTNRKMDLGGDQLEETIRDALGGGKFLPVHGTRLATDLTGDSIATNVFMMGYASQRGLLPVSVASIEEAIRLNGTFVKGNLRTFALGRLAAHAPEALSRVLAGKTKQVPLDTLDQLLESRVRLLTDFQDASYAAEYVDFVREIERAVSAKNLDGGELLVREVALTLARLMTYKDEYEVARLHADPKFMALLREQFDGDFKIKFHLAPPMLPGRDASGRPRKREFGGWMLPVFRVLQHFKKLRGTPFDPFGYTAERRMERRQIADYKALARQLVEQVQQSKLSIAIELAGAAYDIRGYGPVKDASVEEYEARRAALLAALEAPAQAAGVRALVPVV